MITLPAKIALGIIGASTVSVGGLALYDGVIKDKLSTRDSSGDEKTTGKGEQSKDTVRGTESMVRNQDAASGGRGDQQLPSADSAGKASDESEIKGTGDNPTTTTNVNTEVAVSEQKPN